MITKIPIDIQELGESGYHVFIKARIGCEVYDLILDTGASQTVFDKKQFGRYKQKLPDIYRDQMHSAGINGAKLNITFGVLPEFVIGDLQMDNWPVLLINLDKINRFYSMLSNRNIAGLVGSDFFRMFKATIDYKACELTLRFRKKGDLMLFPSFLNG